jgi:hypothetical protein
MRPDYKYEPDATRARVIRFISEYWKTNHCSPVMRDIQVGAQVKSTSHVAMILVRLERDGIIAPREGGLARDIVPMWVRDAIDKAKVEQ